MRFITETTTDGVSERHFVLDDIPGALWAPASQAGGPLILIGHGGGAHKLAPPALARAHLYVKAGFTVAAIDVPERHGGLTGIRGT